VLYAKNTSSDAGTLGEVKTGTLIVGYDELGYREGIPIHFCEVGLPINSIDDCEIFNAIDNVDVNIIKTTLLNVINIRTWDAYNYDDKQVLKNILGRFDAMESDDYGEYMSLIPPRGWRPFITMVRESSGVTVGLIYYAGDFEPRYFEFENLSWHNCEKLFFNMAMKNLFLMPY
jgi:hypothetical protein